MEVRSLRSEGAVCGLRWMRRARGEGAPWRDGMQGWRGRGQTTAQTGNTADLVPLDGCRGTVRGVFERLLRLVDYLRLKD